MTLLAFDPGVTGAFAYRAGVTLAVHDLPVRPITGFVKHEIDAGELARYLDIIVRQQPAIALLERTSARPGQGVSSMFSMGVSRGIILGVLAGLNVHVREVEPRAWKAYFGLIGADKNESRSLAGRLYPDMASSLVRMRDHNRAEALLLLKYLENITGEAP